MASRLVETESPTHSPSATDAPKDRWETPGLGFFKAKKEDQKHQTAREEIFLRRLTSAGICELL